MKKDFQVAIASYPLMDSHTDSKLFYEKLNESAAQNVTIYIHIPFCSQICHYCIYHRVKANDAERINRYVQAVIAEIELYAEKPMINACGVSAIFFGGGTPTVLSAKNISDIIAACKRNFSVSENLEITVETNPINADKEKLFLLKENGVTRISSGIQTFSDNHRNTLGVTLTGDEICRYISDLQAFKFSDVAVDIMYALPGQTMDEAKSDIETAKSLGASHISLYELIIFAHTRLPAVLAENHLRDMTIEEKFEMYRELDKSLNKMKFHNQIVPEYYLDRPCQFWDDTFNPEMGCIAIGCSSYGFLGGVTYQNISGIDAYITAIGDAKLPIQCISKPMTLEQEIERFMVLTSRTGVINLNRFKEKFGIDLSPYFSDILNKSIENGLLNISNKNYVLTQKGKYLQSDLAVAFMQSIFKNKSINYKKLKIGSMRI